MDKIEIKMRLIQAMKNFNKFKNFYHNLSIPNFSGKYNSIDPKVIREYNSFRPSGPRKLICYVPFNNISFSMEGRVLSCNYNSKVMLGNYPEKKLHDIWFSESGEKLRDYMEHNDLSYGCEYCSNFINNKKFSGLKPQVYDKYYNYQKKQFPQVMEFEMINTCNLECVMCNGMASSSIRKNRENIAPMVSPYDDAFVDQLEEFIPHLKEAKFYGGEPFLIDIYHKIWDRMLSINPKINIFTITNGTVMNDKIKGFLERGNFDLAVSVDSVKKEKYEYIRKNANFETVMGNIEYLNSYCRSHNKALSLSTTLMRINWEDVPDMVNFANKIGAQSFFSYLTRPAELALSNLEPEELDNIYEKLSKYNFPEETMLQKYNKYCFQDFLKQIEVWKQINTEKLSPAIDNYNDIERIETKIDNEDCYQSDDLINSAETLFFNNFFQKIKNKYNLSGQKLDKKQTKFKEKFNEVIQHKSISIDKEVLFKILLKIKIDYIIEDIEKKPVRKIVKRLTEIILEKEENK